MKQDTLTPFGCPVSVEKNPSCRLRGASCKTGSQNPPDNRKKRGCKNTKYPPFLHPVRVPEMALQSGSIAPNIPGVNMPNIHNKALFKLGIGEAVCMAHARRKFHELWVSHKSQIAGEAIKLFGRLYAIEREVQNLDATQRQVIRQQQARPAADALHVWLQAHRQRVPDGTATAKAIDYSLGALGCADVLPGGRRCANRQQLGREPNTPGGNWTQQLVICRQSAGRTTCGCGDEPDPLGTDQRP